jgi:hypothetical protein
MTQPLTDSTLVIADRFYTILNANKVSLGLEDVWFGDQDLLPRTPALCVEPGVKRRELSAAQNMTLNTIDTHFLLYYSEIVEIQQQRRATVAFAEAIETFLHQNHQTLLAVGGQQLTIHGLCTDMDPGYAVKKDRYFSAVIITWTSTTKTRLKT